MYAFMKIWKLWYCVLYCLQVSLLHFFSPGGSSYGCVFALTILVLQAL